MARLWRCGRRDAAFQLQRERVARADYKDGARGAHLIGALLPDEVPRDPQGILVDCHELLAHEHAQRILGDLPAHANNKCSAQSHASLPRHSHF